MDFMFEDEVDEVGSDVEAYCPKCKADTTHVVISKYEDEIRRVQCNPCGDVHSFRKPRGEVEDDVPEPIAAKKRALLKKQNWEEFFTKYPERHGKPYEFREAYSENTIVTHPKFGKGFVSELLSDSKVEVTFKDARRVLVHNRKDMPGLPLAAEGDGIPSKGPKAKAVKSKAAAKETAPPPPPVAAAAPPPAVSSKTMPATTPAAPAPPAKTKPVVLTAVKSAPAAAIAKAPAPSPGPSGASSSAAPGSSGAGTSGAAGTSGTSGTSGTTKGKSSPPTKVPASAAKPPASSPSSSPSTKVAASKAVPRPVAKAQKTKTKLVKVKPATKKKR